MTVKLTDNVSLSYERFYVIAHTFGVGGKYRVTQDGNGYLQFAGRRPGEGDTVVGVLEFSEEAYQKWFGKKDKMPGFETAESAVRHMVAHNAHLAFGCPFCAFQSKSLEAGRTHIEQHTQAILSNYRLTVEAPEAEAPAPEPRRKRATTVSAEE
jgi:hypothetical protein